MVEFGILLSQGDVSQDPVAQLSDTLSLVEAAQAAGFSYIAMGQHFMSSPERWLQPVPLLARLAAELDDQVRLATQILITPLYHPVLLAEELATLDITCNGRLIAGFGTGYRQQEFEIFGVPFEERGSRTDEAIALIARLWTEDEVEFHGRYWTVSGIRTHVRPLQQPHPPIWVGGQSTAGARRAGRLGDALAIPPRVPVDDVGRLLDTVAGERQQRGLPVGVHSLRREIYLADTDDDALTGFGRVAGDSYFSIAGRTEGTVARTGRRKIIEDAVKTHALVGTPRSVAERLGAIVRAFPVDPVIIRPQWPRMRVAESISQVTRFGAEVMPYVAAASA